MDLKTYLWKYKMNMVDLAKKVGCSYSSMSAYVNFTRRPRMKMAQKIEECTNGEVTAFELISGQYTMDVEKGYIISRNKEKETVASNTEVFL